MLHTKFRSHQLICSGEENSLTFAPYFGVKPCWRIDPHYSNNFSFLKALDAVSEIWLQLASRLQRRSHLKLGTDRRVISSPSTLGSGVLKIGKEEEKTKNNNKGRNTQNKDLAVSGLVVDTLCLSLIIISL